MVLLIMVSSQLLAQETITFQDETFVLDSTLKQKKNYRFLASDSIVLDTNFSRISNSYHPISYYSTEFVIDENGVFPPSMGLQGGPNVNDKGYVGSIGGSVDVGLMGNANYTIPLDLPIGINGMTPELAIVYNSQGDDGMLGWRWEMGGLSSITRTGKTRYHDRATGGVTLSETNDRFLLDGQRLIQVHNYKDSIEFKTEQDEMSKIMAYLSRFNGGEIAIVGFRIWKSDGRIIDYGMTSDAKILGQDNRPNAICWLISQISDRNGNAIVYNYDFTRETGEYYVSEIKYTKNTNLKISPEFVIKFVYQNKERDDCNFKFVAGNIIQKKKLLKRLEIRKTIDEELIGKYSFEYEETGNNSSYDSVNMYNRLSTVCYEKGGMALNPTCINWTSKSDPNVVWKKKIDDPAIYNNFPFVGDFNGDGYSDLAVVPFKNDSIYYSAPVNIQFFLNNQNSSFSSSNIGMETQPTKLDWIYVLDIDDDGYDDLVTFYYDSLPERSEVMVYRNNRIQDSICFVPVWENPLWFNNKAKVVIGDFEGEGKQSILAYAITAEGNKIANITYVTFAHGWCYTHPVDFVGNGIMKVHQTEPGDYDGDGRTELFFIGQNESRVLGLYNNKGYMLVEKFEIAEVSAEAGSGKNQVFAGDFNGDGLSDLLYYGVVNETTNKTFNDENGEKFYFMFSKATGFDECINSGHLPLTMLDYEPFSNSIWKIKKNENGVWNSICISDFDGDGISDVAVIKNEVGSSDMSIYFKFRRDSRQFLASFSGSSYNGSHTGTYINCRTQYMHVGTFVNKENCSFLGLQKKEGNIVQQRTPSIYRLKSVGELNNVNDITDGLGNRTDINYTMLLQPYQEYNHKVRSLPVPMRVVDSITSSNVAGRPVSINYDFVTPCFHRDGHGFIGFMQTSVTTKRNGRNHTKTVIDYDLGTMNSHALLLPAQRMDSVYPYGNNTTTLLSKTTFAFQKVVNSRNTLVTCPAVTKKEVWNYDVDSFSGGLVSKEVVEYGYNYNTDNQNNNGYYTHGYSCTESRWGTHDTDVNAVSSCDFKTIVANVYDEVHPSVWILERKIKQITTQFAVGKESKVSTNLFYYVSDKSYQLKRCLDIPNTESSNDPLTLQTDYFYMATGNVHSETLFAPLGNNQEMPKRKFYEYGQYGMGRLMTSERIEASTGEYKNVYSYDNHDNVTKIVGYNGLAVCYDADPLGITSVVNNPDGTVTAQALRWASGMRFAPQGASYCRWSRTSGRAKQLVFYHKTGAELRTVSFGPNSEPILIDKKYNDMGLVDSVSNPYFFGDTTQEWTHYEYDFLDRPIVVTTPDSVRTETDYQGLTTTTRVILSNDEQRQSITVSNVKGWTVSNCDPTNTTVNYDYYSDGKLASMQIGNVKTTRIEIQYDNRGNRRNLTDPDYGTTKYTYNAFGEIVRFNTPKTDEFTYTYDELGRLVEKRNIRENTTTFYHYNNSGRLKGTLNSIIHDSQTIHYEYDTLARPIHITEMLFGMPYDLWMEYDPYSRVSRVAYPTGIVIRNGYSAFGHHVSVSEDNGRLLWRADKTNANGQFVQTTMGNGIVTNWQYDSKTHRLTDIVTSKNLQSLHFDYDKFGNLAARTDLLREMTETFEYDFLNRLTREHFGQSQAQSSYDQLGRMTSKQAFGVSNGIATVQTVFSQPRFEKQKIHAVKEIRAEADWFERKPFLATYTTFDKIRTAKGKNTEMEFWYGFNEQRIRVLEQNQSGETEKTYALGCEFLTDFHSQEMKTRTFLTCPTGVFAVVEQQNGDALHFILKDHLGSWTVIADENGQLEQELSYDAWGNLRDPDTWCVDATIQPMLNRGYTGHEHHVGLRLINMNGRLYDPVMSSFLSVDRFVQSPSNSQGFNRYAYCMYNPLRFTDPSGWLCGPPKSKSGLIQDYLADPCYITRQALRDAGLYDIEGGYGYASGHGTMCVRWKEGDGSSYQSSWNFQTGSGGMSCGAWATQDGQINCGTTGSSNVYESNWGSYNQPVGLPTGGGGGSSGGFLFDSNATSVVPVQSHAPQKIHSAKNLFFKTYWHYQFGGRKPFIVDASTLNLSYISFDDLHDDGNGNYSVDLFKYSKSQTALALGKISLTIMGNNLYQVNTDKYDFDIEWGEGWTKRNIGTFISGYIHGPVIDNVSIPVFIGSLPLYGPSTYWGGSFDIEFINAVYIKP